MSLDDQITATLQRYETQDGYSFYTFDRIPEKKCLAALQYYGVPEELVIFALLDCTVFGSAKHGLALTIMGLHWRNASTSTAVTQMSWNDVRAALPQLQAEKYALRLGPEVAIEVAGSGMEAAVLGQLLREVAPLFCQLIGEADQQHGLEEVEALLPHTLALLAMNEGKINEAVIDQAITAVEQIDGLDRASVFGELSQKLQHYLGLGQQSTALLQLEQAGLVAQWQALGYPQQQILHQVIGGLTLEAGSAQQFHHKLLGQPAS